ncbi:unnamed protein product, partial [Symbiodinium sp. KB8]
MLDSTRWVVHLPVCRDEEHPKAEEYGPDAVVVNVSETYNKNRVLLDNAYEFSRWRKPLIVTTNYHLDGLKSRSVSE